MFTAEQKSKIKEICASKSAGPFIGAPLIKSCLFLFVYGGVNCHLIEMIVTPNWKEDT